MTVTLGFTPVALDVPLTKDADFIATIQTQDSSSFPSGAAVTLELTKFGANAITWAASISGGVASWDVDKAVVNALIPGTKYAARVLYSDSGGNDLVWFTGHVTWNPATGTGRTSLTLTTPVGSVVVVVPVPGPTGASGGGGGSSLAPTAVKTANYTAAASDLVPVDTTVGNVTITLPTAPTDKAQVGVKHVIRGGTNVVTVAAAGSDVFNKAGGGTTLTLTLVNQATIVQYKAAGAIWYVVSDDLSLAQLDLRYDAVGAASAAQAAAAADATTKANAAQAFAIQRGNHTGTQSADTIVDGTTNKVLSAADKTRLANTSGTNTGDQDLSALAPKASPALTGVPTVPTAPPGTNSTQAASTAYADAAAAAASVGLLDYRGTYNASGNTFPASGGSGSAGAVVKGDFWIVATPGTLGGTAVANGDLVIALTDTPGQTAANWDLIEHDVGYTPLNAASNLSDLTNVVTARSSLALGTAATANKVAAGSAGVLDATDATTTDSRVPKGAAGGDLAGTYPNPTLKATGMAGTFGDATHTLTVTTDAQGRVTAVTTNAISGGGSSAGPTVAPLTAGIYWDQSVVNGGGRGGGNQANGFIVYTPFIPQRTVTITKFGVNVATAVAASTLRLAIYSDNGSSAPGTLLIDAGTVSSAATGLVLATIASTTLTAGVVYWFAVQASAASIGVTVANPAALPAIGVVSGRLTAEASRQYHTFTYGAFPSTPNALTLDTANTGANNVPSFYMGL